MAIEAPASYEFTTGAGPTPQPAVDWSVAPAYGSAPAPVNALLVARSGRPMPAFMPLLFEQVSSPSSGPQTVDRLPVSATLSADRKVLVLTPREPLPAAQGVRIDFSAVRDITGRGWAQGMSFTTTGERDETQPEFAASSPEDDATGVSVRARIRVALNEPAGLATRSDALRLLRNGEPWPGEMLVTEQAIEFRPARPLDANAGYTVELDGLADRAGNLMQTPRTLHFRTGPAEVYIGERPYEWKSSLDAGVPGPEDPIEVRFNTPMAAGAAATVTLGKGTSTGVYTHPVRVETSGNIVRIVPLVRWPYGTELSLTVNAQDYFGQAAYYSARFVTTRGSDVTRPEVVAITPPPSTPIFDGQAIRIEFSEPMRTDSDIAGLLVRQGIFNARGRSAWSEDCRSVTVVLQRAYTGFDYLTSPFTVVASSALVDMDGNSLKPVAAQFLAASQYPPQFGLPSVQASWPRALPDAQQRELDPRGPITFLLSRPVDTALLNRAVWAFTSEGRVPGTWEVSEDGLLATFRQEGLWPAGTTQFFLQTETVIDRLDQWSVATTPASAYLQVVRKTLDNYHPFPANAVIEVEYNRELPAGPGPLTIVGVPFDESQPRPRVRRLTPRGTLTEKSSLAVRGVEGGALAEFAVTATVGPPITAGVLELRYRAPLPGAADVPRNARIALVYHGSVNELSVNETSVQVLAGGRAVLACPSAGSDPHRSILITPLEPLPANQDIEVRVEGVEDRLGRALPPISWTFHTGSGMDFRKPQLLYSNASGNPFYDVAGPYWFDPETPLLLEFDEPLDPWLFDRFSEGLEWELSPDLRTVTLVPPRGWNRGDSYDLRQSFSDLSGNGDSPRLQLRAGFAADNSPLILLAASLTDGQTGVPMNVAFSLAFNRPVGPDALRTIRLMRGSERLGLLPPDSPFPYLRFYPAAPLQPNTNYTLVVEGVRDTSGNLAEARTITFTTGEEFDLTPPLSVPRFITTTAPVRVKFSEPIDPASAFVSDLLSWYDESGAPHILPVSIEWLAGCNELAITPHQRFVVGRDYALRLGAVTDLAGNGIVWSSEFRFKAMESADAGPTRVVVYPADGSTNVPPNAFVYAWFSRAAPVPDLRLYEQERLVLKLSAQTGPAVKFPHALSPGTRYRVEVDRFRDDSGNDVPGVISSFTTGTALEGGSLHALSSTPANGDAGVPMDRPLEILFNKTLSPAVYFNPPLTGSNFPLITTNETNGPLLTVRPSPSWPGASTIYLGILPSMMIDRAGNPLDFPVNVSFKTAASPDTVAPVLESVNPPAGTLIPGGQTSIELHFSKPVGVGNGGVQVFYASPKDDNYTGIYSGDLRTVTLVLSPPANSSVTIVGTEAIRDIAGNSAAPFTIEFPTGEAMPSGWPKAQMVEPAGYGTYPPTTTILVSFDRVMDVSSVMATLHVTQDGENVGGSIDVLEGGRFYRFRPDMPLTAGATIKVYVDTAMDPQGRIMRPANYPLGSFVVAGAGNALTLLRPGFFGEAPADAVLEAEFDDDLDPASVNGDSMWLRRGSRLVSGHVSLRDGRIVQFIPDAALETGGDYVLTIGAALRAADGGQFGGQDLPFRAVPPEVPARVETVEQSRWNGRDAVRVRFRGRVSLLAARSFALELGGHPVRTRALPSTDGREIWLVPDDQVRTTGALIVVMGETPARNGRLMQREQFRLSVR